MLKNKILSAAGGEEKQYVDSVFSTYLYTGNGSSQTINNGIDLAGKGGLVWTKARNQPYSNMLRDTIRGVNNFLVSDLTDKAYSEAGLFQSFNSNGFTLLGGENSNQSGVSGTSWTFRKAAKFFDVVTWTGNNAGSRQIAHSLGARPGFILLKSTSSTTPWQVIARKDDGNYYSFSELSTAAASGYSTTTVSGYVTSEYFDTAACVSTLNSNAQGVSYVAYLFAHDTSADGIIQCGSFDVDGSGNATVDLGWEPQFVIIKSAEASSGWAMFDNMRGIPVSGVVSRLSPNTSGAEGVATDYAVRPTATGFIATATGFTGASVNGFIYLAIRRPNKPPTTGTEVYSPSIASGVINTGFPVDLHIGATRSGATNNHAFHDRLRGGTKELVSSSTAADTTITDLLFDSNTGLRTSFAAGLSNHFFKRAPGFFDVACYTGTGTSTTVCYHSLGVIPELIFIKSRTTTGNWVAAVRTGTSTGLKGYVTNGSFSSISNYNVYAAATVFSPHCFDPLSGSDTIVNGTNYVAYLFATLPGVSKVGSYTGNGSSQTINCGFTTGCRFFLVKSTSTTGNWWTFDSARGIVAAADPALALNSTAAEITSADAVDNDPSGIIVNQEATCSINASGVSYIFLAIA